MNIVLAQQNYRVGDFSANTQKILSVIKEYGNKADLIVFPELCLSGYYPMDLMERPGFIEQQNICIDAIMRETRDCSAALVIGCLERKNPQDTLLYNALLVLAKGVREFTYYKQLLPTYNIFNEARHFQAAGPSGVWSYAGKRIAFLICEDSWYKESDTRYPFDPTENFPNESLDCVITINASPSNIGKQAHRERIFSRLAKRACAPVVYVNQVGGNDEIVFDGQSFVMNAEGHLCSTLAAFSEDSVNLSLESLQPIAGTLRLSHSELAYQQLQCGLRDYVAKCDFKGILVGSSGGIDSALTLALAREALGAEAVTAITLPSRYSSLGSVEDSRDLCRALGISLFEVPIEEEFLLSLRRFEQCFGEKPKGLVQENTQARIRGRILMEYANQKQILLLSTGNKSELSVGYATLYGDMNGGLNLLGDLYKTDVYELANYYNKQHPEAMIPEVILQKEPSAELAHGQKDSDSLPDYASLDAILRLYIEHDLLTEQEREAARARVKVLDPAVVLSIIQKTDAAEFKRRQAPPIIRVQRRSFGHGRQLPIAAYYPEYHWNFDKV